MSIAPESARPASATDSSHLLAQAEEAFERGDFQSTRKLVDALLGATEGSATTESETVRARALELRRRISPDPLIRYLLLISAVLLVLLAVFAYAQGHP